MIFGPSYFFLHTLWLREVIHSQCHIKLNLPWCFTETMCCLQARNTAVLTSLKTSYLHFVQGFTILSIIWAWTLVPQTRPYLYSPFSVKMTHFLGCSLKTLSFKERKVLFPFRATTFTHRQYNKASAVCPLSSHLPCIIRPWFSTDQRMRAKLWSQALNAVHPLIPSVFRVISWHLNASLYCSLSRWHLRLNLAFCSPVRAWLVPPSIPSTLHFPSLQKRSLT